MPNFMAGLVSGGIGGPTKKEVCPPCELVFDYYGPEDRKLLGVKSKHHSIHSRCCAMQTRYAYKATVQSQKTGESHWPKPEDVPLPKPDESDAAYAQRVLNEHGAHLDATLLDILQQCAGMQGLPVAVDGRDCNPPASPASDGMRNVSDSTRNAPKTWQLHGLWPNCDNLTHGFLCFLDVIPRLDFFACSCQEPEEFDPHNTAKIHQIKDLTVTDREQLFPGNNHTDFDLSRWARSMTCIFLFSLTFNAGAFALAFFVNGTAGMTKLMDWQNTGLWDVFNYFESDLKLPFNPNDEDYQKLSKWNESRLLNAWRTIELPSPKSFIAQFIAYFLYLILLFVPHVVCCVVTCLGFGFWFACVLRPHTVLTHAVLVCCYNTYTAFTFHHTRGIVMCSDTLGNVDFYSQPWNKQPQSFARCMSTEQLNKPERQRTIGKDILEKMDLKLTMVKVEGENDAEQETGINCKTENLNPSVVEDIDADTDTSENPYNKIRDGLKTIYEKANKANNNAYEQEVKLSNIPNLTVEDYCRINNNPNWVTTPLFKCVWKYSESEAEDCHHNCNKQHQAQAVYEQCLKQHLTCEQNRGQMLNLRIIITGPATEEHKTFHNQKCSSPQHDAESASTDSANEAQGVEEESTKLPPLTRLFEEGDSWREWKLAWLRHTYPRHGTHKDWLKKHNNKCTGNNRFRFRNDKTTYGSTPEETWQFDQWLLFCAFCLIVFMVCSYHTQFANLHDVVVIGSLGCLIIHELVARV